MDSTPCPCSCPLSSRSAISVACGPRSTLVAVSRCTLAQQVARINRQWDVAEDEALFREVITWSD